MHSDSLKALRLLRPDPEPYAFFLTCRMLSPELPAAIPSSACRCASRSRAAWMMRQQPWENFHSKCLTDMREHGGQVGTW